jgi:hypothetical protein
MVLHLDDSGGPAPMEQVAEVSYLRMEGDSVDCEHTADVELDR